MTDDTPEVKDQPGPFDEIVNRLILIAPWVALLAGAGYLIGSGRVATNISVSGTIPIAPVAYGIVAILLITYLLALVKFYGIGPVSWVLTRLHTFAKNYNPGE